MRTQLAAFAITALLFSAGCGSGDDSDAAVPQEAAAEGGAKADGGGSEAAASASEAGSEASTKTSEGGSDATTSEGGGSDGAAE